MKLKRLTGLLGLWNHTMLCPSHRVLKRDWRDGSTVTSTCSSSSGPQVPSAQVRQLTAICTFRWSYATGFLGHLYHVHISTHRQTHSSLTKNSKKKQTFLKRLRYSTFIPGLWSENSSALLQLPRTSGDVISWLHLFPICLQGKRRQVLGRQPCAVVAAGSQVAF